MTRSPRPTKVWAMPQAARAGRATPHAPAGHGHSATIAIAERDIALTKALERREEIERQLPALTTELKRLNRFIVSWFDMAGVPIPRPLIRVGKNGRSIPRVQNPPKESVAAEALAVLREAGRPMKRRELLEALSERGLILNGKDPSMVLSTMLWRSQDAVARTLAGYVPASEADA